ncbi:hypothetical protein [Nannocystis radixulma]|uniref:Lipocalin-like domain-containing protein n=1 Tax=Nannocystis radixulma TaxID=2995305 RepID=A0ABT5B8M8_9BACT|nr:hypothetical protein [Nannocystis radixulma]MDC0670472.1 hypothetical protein [Nannocystis radixulma]
MRRAVDRFRLLLALAVASGCVVDACDRRPSLTGTWRGEAIAEEPPLGTLTDVMTFEAHGTLVETRPSYVPETPLGPLLQSGGLGAWAQVGAHDYHARFTFLLQGAPDHPEFAGVLLGTDTVTLELSLDAGDHLSGEFASEIRDTKGGLVFKVRGTYEGSRFTASGSSD